MHLIPSFTFEGLYLGPVYVYTWGLTAAIGVLVAVLMVFRKVRSRITENNFWNFVIILVIAIFLGARISYILETWSYYSTDPLGVLRLWEGGFSFFGGAAGGILAGYLWGRLNKIDFLYLGWLFTPAWLFGLFFGRLGCFLIHDHLGKPTDLPWGVFVQDAYRHEPALYEAVWVLIIGAGLYLLDRRYPSGPPWRATSLYKGEDKSFAPSLESLSARYQNGTGPAGEAGRGSGEVYSLSFLFPLSLLLYSLGRFFLDFLRAADPRFFSFTVAQWISVGTIILISLILLSSPPPPARG